MSSAAGSAGLRSRRRTFSMLVPMSGGVTMYGVSKGGEGFSIEELYRSEVLGGNYAAPVYHDGYLYGMSDCMLLFYDNPQLLKDSISFFVDQAIAVADAEIDSGADAIFIVRLLYDVISVVPQGPHVHLRELGPIPR